MSRQANPIVILIEGTWTGQWARSGSPFRSYLARQGARVLADPFEWSGDVAGLPRALNWWMTDRHSPWRAGGAALRWYLSRLPYEHRNIIAHSHGGHLPMFAAALDIPGEHNEPARKTWIRRLLTVSTPDRADLVGTVTMAKPNIGCWHHIASQDGDLMARLGQLFDGRVKRGRDQPLADQNIRPGVRKIGHSKILTHPEYFHVWEDEHLLEFFRGSDAEIGARDVRRRVHAAAGAWDGSGFVGGSAFDY